MSDLDLIQRLAGHRTLAGAPAEELAWLAARGYFRRAEPGETITQNPEFFDKMVIVLSGHIAINIDRGLGPRKVMEWGPGDVSGALPYSRMAGPPPGGVGIIDQPSDLFIIARSEFPEMIRECPAVTTALVHAMLDRVRRFTTSDLHDEKMMSLGRLSAGLAHELNNPASAAARSAQLLPETLDVHGAAARELGAADLTDAQDEIVERFRKTCATAAPPMRSTIERADREEAIADWLAEHRVEVDAGALVDTVLAIQDLDALAGALHGPSLPTAIRWLASDCSARALASEVERAALRIHTLVAAVKSYTYMDRTLAPEPITLADSFHDSLALLQHKARNKSVNVAIDLPPDLPCVRAIGSDLNQVWMNLLDNAFDAVPERGSVEIRAERRVGYVLVRIVDNGPGIPADIVGRIFDPFFTTKPVGQGTGLGLDIAQRLVRRNDGDIAVESRPGRTEFDVTLPVALPAH